MKTLFVLACTAAFGAAGHFLGMAVHGTYPAALLPLLSGAAGGFGIAWALLDVRRRWQASH